MQGLLKKLLHALAVVSLSVAMHVSAAVLYVDLNSTNPVPPFSSWSTAATNIQDAVDVATSGDQVLVTNGIYQTGGRVLPGSSLTNRLVLTNNITVQGVNGPSLTAIAGYQIPGDINGFTAVRCVYLANGAALTGFTITQGSTFVGGTDGEFGDDSSGAGIFCPLGDPSTASNCVFVSNFAGDFGGGIYGGTLYNCLVVSNAAFLGPYGGGTFGGNYYNCTITANIAGIGAGDAFGNLVNCIVYGNYPAGGNYAFSTLNYCCTDVDPGGTGNVIGDPLFVNAATGNFHLQAASPCINAGNNTYATTTTDLAGNPRISDGTVDMGAYEVQFHYVDQNGTNPVSPFSSWATAATNIQDAVDAASNYDEVLVTNGVYAYGGDGFGDSDGTRVDVSLPMTVQSVNGPGVTIIEGYPVLNNTAIRCVSLSEGDKLIGFTLTDGGTWRTSHGPPSGANIGGGVRGQAGNSVVSNCVIAGNGSNSGGGAGCDTGFGPATMILYNCILSNNTSIEYGGGAYGCTLVNCQLIENSAPSSGFSLGGGAAYCNLYNCTIASNSEVDWGGGAYASVLNNCTIAANSATISVGGVYDCALYNCILASNSSPNGANFDETTGDALNYCCTTPQPTNGLGNITNAPLFVNPAAGDFHLQSNSPCINAGNNAYVSTATDLDGNPRISGGTVDIGAYEFQNPASIISYAWLDQYGLPTDGSADFLDPDHDGLNNWQEWLAGTNPTNASSVLQMLAPTPSGTNLIVTWQSVTNITYSLQRATDLTVDPAFQTIATNLPGQSGTTSYTDTNASPPGPYYYRVGVQ